METPATSEKTQILIDVSQNAVYLMGASFVLGSLFTLLLLLLLDYMRRNKSNKPNIV